MSTSSRSGSRATAASCCWTWTGRWSGDPAGTEDDVTVDLTDDDRTWSFQRVIDQFVGLAQGRDIENRSPGELGARVVDVLDGMARSALTGGRVTDRGLTLS